MNLRTCLRNFEGLGRRAILYRKGKIDKPTIGSRDAFFKVPGKVKKYFGYEDLEKTKKASVTTEGDANFAKTIIAGDTTKDRVAEEDVDYGTSTQTGEKWLSTEEIAAFTSKEHAEFQQRQAELDKLRKGSPAGYRTETFNSIQRLKFGK